MKRKERGFPQKESYNAEKVWDKTRESCAMYTKK